MFTPDQVREMLKWAESKPERWCAAVNTIIQDLVEAHAITRTGAVALAREAKEFREFFDGLRAQVDGGVVVLPDTAPSGSPPSPATPAAAGPTMGDDGDAVQAEAERLMNEAAGPNPADASLLPSPRPASRPGMRRGRPVPGGVSSAPSGAPRVGADGTPITDPAQAAAEDAMDEAMGLK